jgi:hypothetical protein
MTQTPEQIVAEEARARLWRRQQTRRVQFQSHLWRSLAGSPSAIRSLRMRWGPVLAWQLERQQPEVDPEEELDPMGMSDTVNVGE